MPSSPVNSIWLINMDWDVAFGHFGALLWVSISSHMPQQIVPIYFFIIFDTKLTIILQAALGEKGEVVY